MHFLCFNDHPNLTAIPQGVSRFLDYDALMETLHIYRKSCAPFFYTLLNHVAEKPKQVIFLLVFSNRPLTGRDAELFQSAQDWLQQAQQVSG